MLPIHDPMVARNNSRSGSAIRASVIIPVYNKVELTIACVESLIAAGWNDDDELIIVDNASTDQTPAFLAALDGDVGVISNKTNRNFSGACNQGAQAARGEWLVFLNNDTIVTPGWIDGLIEEAKQSQASIVGCRLIYPDGTIQHGGVSVEPGMFPRHLWKDLPAEAPGAAASYDCQIVTAACMLVESSVFAQLNGFDEAFRNGCEDIDLCLRAREAGMRVRYCGKVSITHCESRSPGRHEYDERNAQLFLERWARRLRADRVCMDRIIELAVDDLPWYRGPVDTSVVVVASGDPARLEACMSSLQHAGLEHGVELIVAVAAPSDEVLELCDFYAGAARIDCSVEPLPLYRVRNTVVQRAAGSTIVFLNDTVSVSSGWLQPLRTALVHRPRIGLAGFSTDAPDSVDPDCVAVRRNAFVAAHGFQPDEQGVVNLIDRMKQIGMKSYVVHERLIDVSPGVDARAA